MFLDFSSILRSLNDLDDLDKLRKDSTMAEIALSNEEKWVSKILRKTEPLLKIKDNDEIAKVYRKFFEFVLQKTRLKGDSILHICVKCDDLKVMERLWAILHKYHLYEWLQLRNSNKETCAHLACALNKPEILREILRYGGDVNAVDVDGNTALHIAIQENHDECVEAILNIDSKDDTTENNINLSILNDNGYTPLHLACMHKNLNAIKMLDTAAMKTKQTIFDDIEGKHGNNALHIAIESGAVGIVEYIVQNKRINLTKMNKSGHTALYLARVTRSIEMMNLIQRNGAQCVDNNDHDGNSKYSFDSQDAGDSTQARLSTSMIIYELFIT